MLVFDTETTGLLNSHLLRLPRQPEVIECSIVRLNDDGTTTEVFNHLIKPNNLLPKNIIDITRIKQEDVDGAQPFTAYVDELAGIFAGEEEVCGHNLSFDMEMMDIEFERLGRKVKWPRRKTCTVEQTVHLKGYRLNLGAMHELLFNTRFPEAHRAMNDTLALARCVHELRMRGVL